MVPYFFIFFLLLCPNCKLSVSNFSVKREFRVSFHARIRLPFCAFFPSSPSSSLFASYFVALFIFFSESGGIFSLFTRAYAYIYNNVCRFDEFNSYFN